MNLLTLINLISSFIYISLGIYCHNAGKLEPESKTNKLFSILCLCFAVWGFSFAFLHSSESKNEIEIWYNISSIGWCLFSGFVIHLNLLMTGKESVFKNKWIYIPIYLPGIIFIIKEFTGNLYAKDFIRIGYGYSEIPDAAGIWFWLFIIHQTACELLGMYLLFTWGKRSHIKREKKLATALITTSGISLIIAFTSDILLPAVNIFILPAMSPVFILIWGYGLWYSISRYKFMSLNRSFTSDEIASRMKDLFFILDLDGNIVKINHQVIDFLGLDEKKILKTSFQNILTNKETLIKKLQSLTESNAMRFENINEFNTLKNGSIPVKISGSLLMDKFGDPVGVVIIASDLREKIQLQLEMKERAYSMDALRESQERYRLVMENINDAVFICRLDGHLKYMSPSMFRLTGYSVDEMVNAHYLHFIRKDYRKREHDLYTKQVQEDLEVTEHEYPFIVKGGAAIWVGQSVRMVKNNEGNIEFFGVIRDISERKAAEEALLKNEMLFQQLMENVSDCVFICRQDGHFIYFNPAITRIIGYHTNDLIGKHFLAIVHPEYREQQKKFYLKQVSENIETTYYEFPIVAKNDETIWVGQTVRMIRNNEDEIEFYGITRDITFIKKAEDARRELEEAKTRFFANISHEIRTPLTLMLGPIESVLQGDYGREIGNDFFKSLHRNTLSLLKLVNNLLDFSKIDAGKMSLRVQKEDIVAFTRHYLSSIKLAGKSKNINLNFKSSAESIMLFFDPQRMDKVIMNLLSNALKFTVNGGTISMTISEDDDNVRISVIDTGEGIPEKSLSAVFDRFSQADTTSTRKHEGTGIGLALAKELAELHGGSISVESRFIDKYPHNHGSTFTVIIPKGIAHFENRTNIIFNEKSNLDDYVKDYRLIGISELEDSKDNEPDSNDCSDSDDLQPNGNQKTILVVDDNEDMRNFLKILLQNHYRVITADNGEAGISCMRKIKPDLIVTDVMMPVMNGFEMTAIIKNDESLKTTPVIMLTADTDLMNKVAGLENGADDYLHKPFNSLELMTRISSLLKNYEYQQIISRRNADIERELEVARQLQERLLPSSMPEVSGFHEYAVYIPMDKVGGDFYSIELHENLLDIFIADVSGHGLPGAFLASVTKMGLENIPSRTAPVKVLNLLNNVINRHTVNSNFVTAFYAVIDINTRIMKYSNAGHTPTILYRQKTGEFIELRSKGTILGFLNKIELEEKIIQLESNDRIVFYTDGITECTSPANEMFNEIRFRKTIREQSGKTAEEFSNELLHELERFKGENKFDDDITMVVLDVL